MANVRWLGRSNKIAQVDTLTIGGTIEVGDLFKATINGKTLSHSATSTVAATVATAFATAWNALTAANGYPEFEEVTAAANGADVTLTADTAGKPFTVTIATTESDGSAADLQTFVKASTTASAGPNHWDTAANWSGGAVPVNTDDAYIDSGDVDILYGLDQGSITLTSLTITQGYRGNIGLPTTNTDNNSTGGNYREYRTQYLTINATTVNIGQGVGQGSGRIKIDQGTVQTTWNVYGSGQRAENDVPAVLLLGTHASNVLNAFGGDYAVAFYPTEVSTIATLRQGENPSAAVQGYLGPGCTLTTIEKQGGALEINSAFTTLNQWSGETNILGSGAATTINCRGGTVLYSTSGTLTTLNLSGSGVADFSRDPRSKTVSAVEISGNLCRLIDPNKVAGNIVVDFNETRPGDQVEWGTHVRLTRGTPA